ncbi:hypothetical protein [Asticcacaulis sp. AC402]|uniref:hypothetical protein n=1 Tax=Asticcacaulis sp. AC402 TaxID=1282361 RepID=UPI0003C3D092|nr:hypothetical protein [Asticcacaulis sp. AC402]ESQ77169.1 hypothetical protein ABAC402_01855 [Asticcacaulis sp. AC402]
MMTVNKTRLITSAALTGMALLGGALLLSACGKLGTLEQAPPVYGDDAKASWSASKNAGGGSTATLDDSAAPNETERALPQADDDNRMDDPYRGNKKVQDAPLEGFGNATIFNNNTPK